MSRGRKLSRYVERAARLGPGAAGGMLSCLASLRMYAPVNGDNRSTSAGPMLARSAAKTASITCCRASSWAASVRR